MGQSRLALFLTLAVAALLGVGVALAVSGSPTRSPRALAAAPSLRPPSGLLRQLRQYLAGPRLPVRPRIAVPRSLPLLGPTVCLVAGGSCSLTPCIELARAGVDAVSDAVVLRMPAVPLARPSGAAIPGSSCPGRRGAPRVVRVIGP